MKWIFLGVIGLGLSGCLLEHVSPTHVRYTVTWEEVEQVVDRYGVQYAELAAQFSRATTDEQRVRINARMDALNNSATGALRLALERPGKVEIVVVPGAAVASATTRPGG